MFDFAWSELALIGALSVLLLGPKQLPDTMRSLAKIVRKLRGLSAEFQGHFNDMVREAELEELRTQVQKLSSSSVSAEVGKFIDPTGEISGALKLDPSAPVDLATGESAAAAVEDQTTLIADPAASVPAASPAAPSPTVHAAVETPPPAAPAATPAASPAPPAST
jgi:sec-independent protein translocase protein TatB